MMPIMQWLFTHNFRMPKYFLQKIILLLHHTKAKEWHAKRRKYHAAKSVEIILKIESRN